MGYRISKCSLSCEENVRNFIEKIMRTASGRRLTQLVLCP